MAKSVELVWDGKYDKDGRRVSPPRIAMPTQTIETLNESSQDRQTQLALGAAQDSWRNRLIWGDKRYILPSLLQEFSGKVDLIYIDPPFDTGADFSFMAGVPDYKGTAEDDSREFIKKPSLIEQKAYRDTWGVTEEEKRLGIAPLDKYLRWFYESVVLLHELLKDTGAIYVHLDWHVGHYAKAILDEVFGVQNYRNDIYWYYYNKMHDARKGLFPRATDMIFYYVKNASADYVFNAQHEKRDKPVQQLARKKIDGRMVNVKDAEGNLVYNTRDVRTVDNVWRISMIPPADRQENANYPTQKPEALLRRVVETSTNEGDLVLDCFCGSGTTAVVAEKLKRRWIGCDLGRFAIHTTRKRLLKVEGVRPFLIQNLGKYERQMWQAGEFTGDGDSASNQQSMVALKNYTSFLLGLWGATPVSGSAWIHGSKGGRMVHVGAVDAPVSVGDVTQIAAEFRKLVGTGEDAPKTNGVDVLGWDFAFEINEVAKQQAAAANIHMRFLRIPREVMDPKAVEQGDIRFFELAALSVTSKTKGLAVALKLADFIIPPDDVPEDVRKEIKHWSQWIDYWAVDWDNKDDTFHNEWQAFRTREENSLALDTEHTYEQAGEYVVVVKVIDILGNDTTKTLKVKVK